MWHRSTSYSIFAILFAAFVAWNGYRKQSLSASGAIAACVVGALHLLAGPQFGLTLIVFFYTSSKLTKLKADVKARIEDDFQYGGNRSAMQVLVNSFGGTVCAVAGALQANGAIHLHNIPSAALLGGFLGHYACCCADTWASEVGILSKASPRLVTTFKVVPKGTNGGVSILGTLCGIAGGLCIGLTFWLSSLLTTAKQATLPLASCIAIAVIGGLLGNLLDSTLGATLQYSGFDTRKRVVVTAPGPNVKHISGYALLSNSQVNLISSIVTSLTMGSLAAIFL